MKPPKELPCNRHLEIMAADLGAFFCYQGDRSTKRTCWTFNPFLRRAPFAVMRFIRELTFVKIGAAPLLMRFYHLAGDGARKNKFVPITGDHFSCYFHHAEQQRSILERLWRSATNFNQNGSFIIHLGFTLSVGLCTGSCTMEKLTLPQ